MTESDMLFYRSTTGGRSIGRTAIRLLTLVPLVAYPAGALTAAWGDDRGSAILGYGLVLAALACVTVLMGTSIQRIVGEVPDRLDEYELTLRSRAMSAAYTCLSALVLVGIIYFAIGSDKGLWVPDDFDELNGLFWGAFLYATLLPSAFLAWQVDPADLAADG